MTFEKKATESKVSKRVGTKNSDNRSFKHGNRYSDKSLTIISLGFEAPSIECRKFGRTDNLPRHQFLPR
jgi:hypothetical protein